MESFNYNDGSRLTYANFDSLAYKEDFQIKQSKKNKKYRLNSILIELR